MPLIALPPQPVPTPGFFDYVTVDAARHRVYAAHGGARALLVVDADTGAVLRQITVGPMAGSAIDPQTGDVFTGNGRDDSLSEIDPVTGEMLHTVAVQGPVDAIAYDPALHRIYGDEDDGTRIFVIDATSFKEVAVIALPGHKPEYIQIDPQTHEIYQNISDPSAQVSAVAVIDPRTLAVTRTIPTPDLSDNHPLQYDARDRLLIVAGENERLDVYDLAGRRRYSIAYPYRVDQCSFEPSRGWLACAGGGVTLLQFDGSAPPRILAHVDAPRGLHTCAIDSATGVIFAVWGSAQDAYVGRFVYRP